MTAIGYARVSTDKQENSANAQEKRIRAQAEVKDLDLSSEEYSTACCWNNLRNPDEHSSNCRVMRERKRAAAVASGFTMKPDRSIHPDIKWDDMNESAQLAAHTTAQQIAFEILLDPKGGAKENPERGGIGAPGDGDTAVMNSMEEDDLDPQDQDAAGD